MRFSHASPSFRPAQLSSSAVTRSSFPIRCVPSFIRSERPRRLPTAKSSANFSLGRKIVMGPPTVPSGQRSMRSHTTLIRSPPLP